MLHGRSAIRRLAAAFVVIAAGLVHCPAASAGQTIIRVVPDGADIPVARQNNVVEVSSLADAFARARAERAQRSQSVVIEIAGGTHRLSSPVLLGPEDGGTPTAPLIVRGAPDGSSRIVASFPLVDAGVPAPALLARIPAEARDHVRLYMLPDAVAQAPHIDVVRRHVDAVTPPLPFEILDRAGALQPARWPNEGWSSVADASDDEDSAIFTVDPGRVKRWRAEAELWAAGYWKWNWSFETRPVAVVDPGSASVTLAEPTHYGIVPGARFYIYHALSELDRPGEWVRTADRSAIVLWPRDDTSDIEISVGESLFILDRTRHVRFENLEFGRTRGDAIIVNGGAGIVVADSTIATTGGRGLVIDGAQRSGLENSVVTQTGATGVDLAAGDRHSLTPAGLFLTRSRITRSGRLGRTYRPAVSVAGVGNAVIGNFIADLPHAAIVFSGNDHRIENNEITRVAGETSDAGAIYTGRDWTARGTKIRNNFLHDIRGAPGFETKGIYLDDMASGIAVEGNLFLRVDQPVFIGGGRDNIIAGNLMVASEPAIHMDARGTGWSKDSVDNPDSELRRNLSAVPYLTPVWRQHYPTLADILDRSPGMPLGNRSHGNVLVGEQLYILEGPANDIGDTLGPDFSTPASTALADLQRARDIGLLAAGTSRTVPWPALPFGRMDRAEVVPTPMRPVN